MSRKKPTGKAILEELLDQLEKTTAIESYFTDLVYDYMELHSTKIMLHKDIADRGASVEYNNGGGQSGFKRNDSIDQALKVNQQMLKILDYLQIKPPKEVQEDDGDYEM